MGLGLRRGKPKKRKESGGGDDDEDQLVQGASGTQPGNKQVVHNMASGDDHDDDDGRVEVEDDKQLCRRAFCDRIRLEEKLRVSFTHCLVFLCLTGSFLGTRINYDPLPRIANIHENMRQRFKAADLPDISTIDEMQAYVQEFILTAYGMASALVDANTIEPLDLSRCFDPDVNDVCRLKYWSLPDYDESLPSYVNMNDLVQDYLGPDNVDTSISCANSNDKANCINTSPSSVPEYVKSSIDKTYGLTPEDPIILKSRLDYPQASVIPFSPLVWMSVATKVPCDGFGNQYNTDILGAGVCRADQPCKPYSKFTNSKPAIRTGRKQTIYITYEEDAFTCVDRTQLATTFMDKSWSPWATFKDFHDGQELTSVEVEGQPVFYKFVSDMSYIQSPITNGDVQACGCDNGNPASEGCTDPLADVNHAMWDDVKGGGYEAGKCSYRRNWASAYQQTDPAERRNTWITMNTTSFTIALVVITPQMAGVSDVVSLVTTEFDIDDVGKISSKLQVRSVSKTVLDEWGVWLAATVFFSLVFSSFALDLRFYLPRRSRLEKGKNIGKLFEVRVERPDFTSYLDLLCAAACITQSVWALVLEQKPPDPIISLIAALETDTTEVYFETVRTIIVYNEDLDQTDIFAMFVTAVLFTRFCLFLSLHPRLAVLIDTLVESADDCFHFLIYFCGIFTIMGVFAHWQFGRELVNYSTFGDTMWSQFLMFVGEIGAAAEVKQNPIFQAYMCLFIFVTLIALMNFLLAIIMNAYTVVTDHLEDDKTEQNVVKDIIDMIFNSLMSWKHNWPATYVLWNHCVGKGMPPVIDKLKPKDKIPPVKAIGADELLYACKDEQGFPAFKSIKHAQGFINWYCRKSGGCIREQEKRNRVPEGVYFLKGLHACSPTEEDIKTLETDLRRELTSERQVLGLSCRGIEEAISEYAEEADAKVRQAEKKAQQRAAGAVREIEKDAIEMVDEAAAIADDLQDGQYDGVPSPREMPNEADVLAPYAAGSAKATSEAAEATEQTPNQDEDSPTSREEPDKFIHSHRQSKHHGKRHKPKVAQKARRDKQNQQGDMLMAIGAMQEEMIEMHGVMVEELAELKELRMSGLAAPGLSRPLTQNGSASLTTAKDPTWNAEQEIHAALNVLSTTVPKPLPTWA